MEFYNGMESRNGKIPIGISRCACVGSVIALNGGGVLSDVLASYMQLLQSRILHKLSSIRSFHVTARLLPDALREPFSHLLY